MGMYICGTLFGAMWISVLSGFVSGLGILHPYALTWDPVSVVAMMAAGTGSIVANYPDHAKRGCFALAGEANLLTNYVIGVYFALFISLPVMEKAYSLATGRTREEDLEADAKEQVANKGVIMTIVQKIQHFYLS